jgi:hypothetical protein
MLVTNTTYNDYWFGPLHLAAGPTSTLTVDDTTETSLYLTDDTVADALNALVVAGKVIASGYALPFPRATGVPSVFHGDGSPEGLVYGPQGSIYMRRDSTNPSLSLYSKTSAVTTSIGWSPISSNGLEAPAAALPSSPLDGQVSVLKLGSSPYDYLRMVYDATATHWYSAVSESVFLGTCVVNSVTSDVCNPAAGSTNNPNPSASFSANWTTLNAASLKPLIRGVFQVWDPDSDRNIGGTVALNTASSQANGSAFAGIGSFTNIWTSGAIGNYQNITYNPRSDWQTTSTSVNDVLVVQGQLNVTSNPTSDHVWCVGWAELRWYV